MKSILDAFDIVDDGRLYERFASAWERDSFKALIEGRTQQREAFRAALRQPGQTVHDFLADDELREQVGSALSKRLARREAPPAAKPDEVAPTPTAASAPSATLGMEVVRRDDHGRVSEWAMSSPRGQLSVTAVRDDLGRARSFKIAGGDGAAFDVPVERDELGRITRVRWGRRDNGAKEVT